MKGATSSRAVLAVVGTLMAVSAMGAGLSPLMNMLGLADQGADVDKLETLSAAVREKCTQARNNEAEFATEIDLEFSSLQSLKVESNNGMDALEASFESSNWKSQGFKCQLSIDSGEEEVTEGEWMFNIEGSSSENPEVTIEANPQ